MDYLCTISYRYIYVQFNWDAVSFQPNAKSVQISLSINTQILAKKMGKIRANWLASYLLENHFPANGMNMLSTRNKSTDVELQPLFGDCR